MRKELSVSVENFTELGMLEKGKAGSLWASVKGTGPTVTVNWPRWPRAAWAMDIHQPHPQTHPYPTPSSPTMQGPGCQRPSCTSRASLDRALIPHNPISSIQNRKDSAKERRSRLPFLRQWSQVGHSKTRFSREEMDKWAESLNALLDSRAGVSVFGAFLRSEFSEENLQFYLACEQYRHSSNNFSLQRRARDICATYIQPGAPREVNLDSKTRELTMQLLQAPSHTSLCHAQKRIYTLLDTDCYPRFLQSNIYLSLLPGADHSP
ncbi:regulator of G-protein signaling 1 [Hypomesus transpacificus]|uniref:regulator of G-protein signaling 1 n=1 Tax=Hypomesus transpacificus TaxID=137520 RepID=UPI001F07DE16|nr:regulator of G-protein signaling 1 [Hypomesus transpacificus]XP_046875087.1 regulator of G-protein signaling 1 [Hypomesus transpacificus]XP_046875088.1 regulator of G-protein signaling 1 [Hypomesus transpacificus]XP_046875089.1 regulator of G-protein signaling 1 [Hypomesus transpacificus]XP_046875090.1 regulator of G-protein signaling 1 [Hypomesus transpacificus]